jgi:putative acetyltransferase
MAFFSARMRACTGDGIVSSTGHRCDLSLPFHHAAAGPDYHLVCAFLAPRANGTVMTDTPPRPPVDIRPEEPTDAAAARQLLLAAFETPAEADLVETLRANATPYIALVAVDGDVLVGHIAFTAVAFDPMRERPGLALGLAPLAVAESHRRRGVGAALAEVGLAACREAGAFLVVTLGDPAYYGRFGFEPAATLGLCCVFEAPPEAFQAMALRPWDRTPGITTVHFRPEFDTFE